MSRKCYRLLDREREYLEEGTVSGGYRPHEMENRVVEKVDLLPTRFECLFSDLKSLEGGSDRTSNYFATDTGRCAWAALMGLEEDYTGDELQRALSFHRGKPGSGPAEFGANLGRAVNRLMHWPETDAINQDDVVADLVWGFLHGLYYDPRPAGRVTEEGIQEDTAKVLDQVEDRAATHAESMQDPLAQIHDGIQQRRATKREMAARVHEILGDDHPSDRMTMGWGFAEWETQENDSTPSQFCGMVVAHLIDSIVDGGHAFNSWEQDQAFWQACGPAETLSVEEVVTESQVRAVIDDRRLFEKHALICELETDAEALATKESQGAEAVKVLPQIVEEGPMSSVEVAEAIYNSRDYTASVTRLARDLAGIKCDERAEGITAWTNRPLLEGDPDGWRATKYGEAANYAMKRYLASQKSYAQPIEVLRVPESLLDEALAQSELKEE